MSRVGSRVHDEMLLARLNNLAVAIADVLEDKCMFSIPLGRNGKRNIATLHLEPLLSKGAPAYYDASNNTVHVLPPRDSQLLEQDYIDILGHEYTHCWEFTNPEQFSPKLAVYNMNDVEDPRNIPYAGKLFTEGAANWGESKVLDYFGLDELFERLKPDAHKSVSKGLHPDFSEYGAGYALMVHLEYHCDFARMLYFLETGEIDYNPREEHGHREHLSQARDYEEWIYPNWQLGIFGAMTNIPSDLGRDAALCIRAEGYSRMPHSTREKVDYPKDVVRSTYLLTPRRRRHADPPEPDLSEGQLGSLEGARPSDLRHKSIGELVQGSEGLTEALEDLWFSCARCSLAGECSLLDACHMHSCGEPGRSTLELLSKFEELLAGQE